MKSGIIFRLIRGLEQLALKSLLSELSPRVHYNSTIKMLSSFLFSRLHP